MCEARVQFPECARLFFAVLFPTRSVADAAHVFSSLISSRIMRRAWLCFGTPLHPQSQAGMRLHWALRETPFEYRFLLLIQPAAECNSLTGQVCRGVFSSAKHVDEKDFSGPRERALSEAIPLCEWLAPPSWERFWLLG